MKNRSFDKRFIAVFAVISALLLSQAAVSQEQRTVVFPLETVNANPEVARAASLTLAAELESRGFTVGDVLAVEALLEKRRAAASSVDAPEGMQPKPEKGDLYLELAEELGADSYFTGRLVGIGGQLRIEAMHYDASGDLTAMQRAAADGEPELPEAIDRLVTALVMIDGPETTPAPTPAPRQAPAPAPRVATPAPAPPQGITPQSGYISYEDRSRRAHSSGRLEQADSDFDKALGVMLVQTIGISDTLEHTTGINFDGRFEWIQFLLAVNAGFNFGDVEITEGLHLNLDLTFAGYLSKKQISPYLGAGFGLYLINRLDNSNICDEGEDEGGYDYDSSFSSDDSCDPNIGWNLFPTFGVEFLRNRSMRLHVELRYVFVLNAAPNWGHGPIIAVGVGF